MSCTVSGTAVLQLRSLTNVYSGTAMCARISLVDVGPGLAWWDPDEQTIYVRRTAGSAAAPEIAAILADLGSDDPSGHTCWCGEPLPRPQMPAQRRAEPARLEVLSRGA